MYKLNCLTSVSTLWKKFLADSILCNLILSQLKKIIENKLLELQKLFFTGSSIRQIEFSLNFIVLTYLGSSADTRIVAWITRNNKKNFLNISFSCFHHNSTRNKIKLWNIYLFTSESEWLFVFNHSNILNTNWPFYSCIHFGIILTFRRAVFWHLRSKKTKK